MPLNIAEDSYTIHQDRKPGQEESNAANCPKRHSCSKEGVQAACNLQYQQYIIRRDRIMGVMNFGLSKIELKYR
jgi:hypothetical protein